MTLLFGISLVGFVILGLPKSAFGVAWPTIADELDRPLAELGLLIAAYMVGYSIVSIATGELTRRFGVGRTMFGSSALATVGLVGYAAAGSWGWLVLAAFALGASGGALDAALNAFVSLHAGARVMGLLHAMFGVGATLGPLIMTWLLAADASWRWAYVGLAGAQALLTVALWLTRDRWPATNDAAPRRTEPRPPGLAIGLVVFFLYAGIEVGAGQWAFSVLVEGRGVGEVTAGYAVTAYWGAVTAGRLLLGGFGDRWPPATVLRASAVTILAGLVAFALPSSPLLAMVGMTVAGLGMAAVFPLAMLVTPDRLGIAYAPWAVGYQLGAATAGAAAIPGGLGWVVAAFGLAAVGWVLVFAGLLLILAMAAAGLLRSTPSRLAVISSGREDARHD